MARSVRTKRPDAGDLLTREEAAAYLGVAAQTLAIWKVTGRYSLPVIKVGRLTRYRRRDLDNFLNQRTVDTSQLRNMELLKASSAVSLPFAEVKLVETATDTQIPKQEEALIEVILPSGIKLRLSEKNSLDLLSSVINVLEKY